MPVTWSDEKLILLYCPGRRSNSRPSARRSFKHDQGVPRPNHSATAADTGLELTIWHSFWVYMTPSKLRQRVHYLYLSHACQAPIISYNWTRMLWYPTAYLHVIYAAFTQLFVRYDSIRGMTANTVDVISGRARDYLL